MPEPRITLSQKASDQVRYLARAYRTTPTDIADQAIAAAVEEFNKP